jgi:hypothetical protein
MKRLLTWAAPALMAGMVFVGCQKNMEDSNENLGRDVSQLNSENCATQCLTASNLANKPFAETYDNDQPNNVNEITVEVWNTATEIRYLIKHSASNNRNVQYKVGNEWVLIQNSVPPNTNVPFGLPLQSGWKACDSYANDFRITGQGGTEISVTYKVRGLCTESAIDASLSTVCEGEETTITGSVSSTFAAFTGGVVYLEQFNGVGYDVVASAAVTTTSKSVSYNFSSATAGSYVFRTRYSGTDGTPSNGYNASTSDDFTVTVENCGCDEAFSYVENGDGTITFTYVPSEDLAGANLVLTFAQSAVVSIPGFTKSGATMQATMDLEACETYTWTATIESLRCTGQGQTTVNAWTDFTVNEVSKKNDGTPNIVRPCN